MAEYINVDMAVEALQKGLYVWMWNNKPLPAWKLASVAQLTMPSYREERFAIGEKPTTPPRKMIEIDGVKMPAPIMRKEHAPSFVYVIAGDGSVVECASHNLGDEYAQGNVFAMRFDAAFAVSARKLILERAMERAK